MTKLTRSERKKARKMEKSFRGQRCRLPEKGGYIVGIDFSAIEARTVAAVCLRHGDLGSVIDVTDVTSQSRLTFDGIYNFETSKKNSRTTA